MIDLHSHTIFSDGKSSPEILLEKAKAAGLKLLAITDHDNTDALLYLKKKSLELPFTLINGIEFSTNWKKIEIHILGLNINLEDTNLKEMIAKQRENRINRAKAIAKQLQELFGIEAVYQKVCDVAGHETVGRPHFAQVLINEHIVKDIGLAFKRILGRGKKGYIETKWLSFEEVIAGIKTAGGDAVLAHPLKYKLTQTRLKELVKSFKTNGGDGIEVVSGDTTISEAKQLITMCVKFDLLASTGSDYHSDSDSKVKLGKQIPLPNSCHPVWEKWTKV